MRVQVPYAFVRMSTYEEALEAIRGLHGTEVQGKLILCKHADAGAPWPSAAASPARLLRACLALAAGQPPAAASTPSAVPWRQHEQVTALTLLFMYQLACSFHGTSRRCQVRHPQ